MEQLKSNYDKFIKNKISIAIVLLLLLGCLSANASDLDGTSTYKDYIFVLVHGIHSKAGMWDGTLDDAKYRDMFGNLKVYLEQPTSQGGLGLEGHIYCYTFSNPDGSNLIDAKEFGDRSYNNFKLDGSCWLVEARTEFIDWFKDPRKNKNNPTGRIPLPSEIPSKYIIVTHSMGNLSVRSYIYSDYLHNLGLLDKGFYQDDIAKVVFIAPPFLGSEVILGSALKYYLAYQRLAEAAATYNFMTDFINNMGKVAWGDPAFVYGLAKKYAAYRIYEGEVWDSIKAAVQGDLFGMGSTNMWDPAALELMPILGLGEDLRGAKLTDPTREPLYSIIYGRGVPSPNFLGTGISIAELKGPTDTVNYLKDTAVARGVADKVVGKVVTEAGMFLNNDFALTLMPNSGFWQMPTEQGKFLSFLMGQKYLTMTNDGDFFVPTWSSKGEGIEHLKNASRYEHIFKSDGFESYLTEQFKQEMAAATIAYYTSKFFGTPDLIAALVYWGAAFSLIDKVEHYLPEIKDQSIYAHGSIVRQYDLIKTAILDTPAIFTINDLQTTMEVGVSDEATTLAFSISSPEAGYYSIKAKGITENRAYHGLSAMAVPSTVNNDRKYIASITLAKVPVRITGKLNYLMPKLMKSFDYSFNFAAWKPIQNVDPETGEFVLDNLPFAEGQNVIAIRSENAVGVKNNQLLKIILNTIPMQPSQFKPVAGSYINNDKPEIAIEFNKSEYSGKYEDEKIIIKQMLVDGEEVGPQIDSKIENYHPWAKASYTIPADKPLADGEHQVAVKAESNVGVAQGLWSFYVDRSPPTISIEVIAPYSPRAPTTIRYNVSDEVSPNLLDIRCDLYRVKGQGASVIEELVTTIATAETLSKGENFFTLDPKTLAPMPPDGSYSVHIKALDLAGNASIATTDLLIDSTAPQVLGVDVSPNPMTSNTTELGLTARVSERSQVIIKLINLSKNTTTAYLTQALTPLPLGEGMGVRADYLWKYDQMFGQGPEDGIYRVEVIARDDAGNESAPRTLEAVRIDRTPPSISSQICQPYVLSNVGANAYKTTLSYDLLDAKSVKIKIYNSNTGQVMDTIPAAPSQDGANQFVWNANNSDLPKGAYKLQIIAADDVGNIGTAYASCVKDGIAKWENKQSDSFYEGL